jgi:hypothetical protein
MGEEYKEECLQYIEGSRWQEEKKRKGLNEKCPFANNSRCGRHWEWWCKGSDYPFLLTTFMVKPNTDDIPMRDEYGEIMFTRTVDDIKDTCFSGDIEIYEECPNYKRGMAVREYVRELKKKG